MPPTAPIIGNKACLGFDNSPCKNSLLISKETKKKKTAIKTSLIQCKTLNLSPKLSVPSVTYFFKIDSKKMNFFSSLFLSLLFFLELQKHTKSL